MEKENKVINIARDFSVTPGGRFLDEGPFTGERFRKTFLEPVVTAGQKATVVLDGVRGYPSSFLEEAFGGLIRAGFSGEQVLESFTFQAEMPGFKRFIARIHTHIEAAQSFAAKT
jgi:hypothetical protein